MSEKCTPEYNEETKRLMDELEILQHQAKMAQRSATRERQLNKQSAEFRERIAAGDTSKAPKREPVEYDAGVTAALLERNKLRNQVDNLVAKGERVNRGALKQVLGIINDLEMGSILASIHVIKHLGYAVIGAHAMNIGADVTRSIARHVPGIKGVADQAPMYGTGVDIDAYKAKLQGLMEAPREAKNQLLRGESTVEASFGKTHRSSDEYLTFAGSLKDALSTPGALNKTSETVRTLTSFVGRSHAAEKEFLVRPFAREAVVRESKFAIKQMQNAGKTPGEIQQIMDSEAMKAAIGAKALARVYYEKMQGQTAFTRSVESMIGTLDRSDSSAANVLGSLIKLVVPIRKVPVNTAIQMSSLAVGGFKALGAALRKGDMTPDRADYIMRNIGQQGVGAAIMLAGALYYNKLGGVPGVYGKKDQPKNLDASGAQIKPGEAEGIEAAAFHGAPFAAAQVGASMMQIFQHGYGKKKGFDLAVNAIASPTLNYYIRTIPYTDTFRRMKNTEELGRGRKGGFVDGIGEIAGNTARSTLIPGFVQQTAAAMDKYKGYRAPQNIVDDVKLGIPGLREQVPIKKGSH
ncbi:MAG: hypothetical protein ABI268_09880 [Rhodanobacter sp.]